MGSDNKYKEKNNENENMEEILEIWQWLCEKYTSKESSSVSYEKGQMLMRAVIFCIEEGKKEQANEMLELDFKSQKKMYLINDKKKSFRQLYNIGYKSLFQRTIEIRKRYDNLIEQFDSYGNQNLYDTVMKGMPQFFLRYDIRFNPEEILLTLDYPVLRSLENEIGIYKIEKFLREIEIEQSFLSSFPKMQVQKLLVAYDADYSKGFFNLTEAVLSSMLFSIWEKEKHKDGEISKTLETAKHVLTQYNSEYSKYLFYLEPAIKDVVYRWNVKNNEENRV